jgi:hypothetical protein
VHSTILFLLTKQMFETFRWIVVWCSSLTSCFTAIFCIFPFCFFFHFILVLMTCSVVHILMLLLWSVSCILCFVLINNLSILNFIYIFPCIINCWFCVADLLCLPLFLNINKKLETGLHMQSIVVLPRTQDSLCQSSSLNYIDKYIH